MKFSNLGLSVAIFLLLAGVVVFADASDENIVLKADYAVYAIEGDTTRSFVEIYYNIPRGQLKFEPDKSGYLAVIDFSISLIDSTGTVVDSASWKAGNRIESLSVLEHSDYLITDRVTEVFSPGYYIIKLEAACGKKKGTTSFNMNVPRYGADSLNLSSLQLAYEASLDSVGRFVKAGYKVLPNPSGRFSQDKNAVYIYAEAYNLDTSPDSDSLYEINIDIFDINGRTVKSITPANYKKPGSSAVILTGFSIATLPRDFYIVRLTLIDQGRTVSREKRFAVVASRERLRLEMLQAVLNEFPQANKIEDEENAGKFRDDIYLIATPDELKLYDSLNLEGKQNFQREFWGSRDPDFDTPENEYKYEHYRRIKYSDDHFGQYRGYIRGWQTDMGRIYIRHGEPSEIERNQSSFEERGWQRWWYHGIEGGVYFIFVDFEGTSSYDLIHSSKKNEVKDYNWEDKVKMTLFQR
ncbi:MAG: GWxTD domain-containing protein [candidate division Zixibacteria bacterium]